MAGRGGLGFTPGAWCVGRFLGLLSVIFLLSAGGCGGGKKQVGGGAPTPQTGLLTPQGGADLDAQNLLLTVENGPVAPQTDLLGLGGAPPDPSLEISEAEMNETRAAALAEMAKEVDAAHPDQPAGALAELAPLPLTPMPEQPQTGDATVALAHLEQATRAASADEPLSPQALSARHASTVTATLNVTSGQVLSCPASLQANLNSTAGFVKAEFYVRKQGNGWARVGVSTPPSSLPGQWSPTAAFDCLKLPGGLYEVLLAVWEKGQLTHTVPATVAGLVLNSPPVSGNLIGLSDGQTPTCPQTLTATLGHPSGVRKTHLWISPKGQNRWGLVNSLTNPTPTSTSPWSVSMPFDCQKIVAGDYDLWLTANDTAGNPYTSITRVNNLHLAAQSITATLSGLAHNQGFTCPLSFSATITAAGGLRWVEWFASPAGANRWARIGVSNPPGNYPTTPTTVDTAWDCQKKLPNGKYDVMLGVRDKMGNPWVQAARANNLNYTAPPITLSLTPFENGDFLSCPATLQTTIISPTGVRLVEWYARRKNIGQWQRAAYVNGDRTSNNSTLSATWNCGSFADQPMDLWLVAHDGAGNKYQTLQQAADVKPANVTLTAGIDSLPDGAEITCPVKVSAQASATAGVASLAWYLRKQGETQWREVGAGPGPTLSCDGFAAGNYNLRVAVTDNTGRINPKAATRSNLTISYAAPPPISRGTPQIPTSAPTVSNLVIEGVVKDEAGVALAGAALSLLRASTETAGTATTGADGRFSITTNTLKQGEALVIKASKQGYVTNFDPVNLDNTSAAISLDIALRAQPASGGQAPTATLMGADGSTTTVTSVAGTDPETGAPAQVARATVGADTRQVTFALADASITFGRADGAGVAPKDILGGTGAFTATLLKGDPTNENDLKIFPGDFTTYDSATNGADQGTLGALISAGFLKIDMTGPSGQEITQFAPGTAATVRMDLNPASINPETGNPVQPGDTIPLLTFNETTGHWDVERTASGQPRRVTVEQDAATGEMFARFVTTHLTWFNLDWKGDLCPANKPEVHVVNQYGQPLRATVWPEYPGYYTGLAMTDEWGVFYFQRAPRDVALKIYAKTSTQQAPPRTIINCKDSETGSDVITFTIHEPESQNISGSLAVVESSPGVITCPITLSASVAAQDLPRLAEVQFWKEEPEYTPGYWTLVGRDSIAPFDVVFPCQDFHTYNFKLTTVENTGYITDRAASLQNIFPGVPGQVNLGASLSIAQGVMTYWPSLGGAYCPMSFQVSIANPNNAVVELQVREESRTQPGTWSVVAATPYFGGYYLYMDYPNCAPGQTGDFSLFGVLANGTTLDNLAMHFGVEIWPTPSVPVNYGKEIVFGNGSYSYSQLYYLGQGGEVSFFDPSCFGYDYAADGTLFSVCGNTPSGYSINKRVNGAWATVLALPNVPLPVFSVSADQSKLSYGLTENGVVNTYVHYLQSGVTSLVQSESGLQVADLQFGAGDLVAVPGGNGIRLGHLLASGLITGEFLLQADGLSGDLPEFSPDGQWVFFSEAGGVYRASPTPGAFPTLVFGGYPSDIIYDGLNLLTHWDYSCPVTPQYALNWSTQYGSCIVPVDMNSGVLELANMVPVFEYQKYWANRAWTNGYGYPFYP